MGAICGIGRGSLGFVGKGAKLPVCKLLGQVQTGAGYASAGFYAKGKSLEDLQKKSKEILDRGFTAI